MEKILLKVLKRFFVFLLLSLVCLANPKDKQEKKGRKEAQKYTIEQAMSYNAQVNTIAFSGLAFLTGTLGADSFMPPGKVADFFGFQYMRDIDESGHGHNAMFLRTVAGNILHILDTDQKSKIMKLAREQEQLYLDFGYNRYVIIEAFRNNIEGDIPEGSKGLDLEGVKEYTAKLYEIDAQLSYRRAEVLGEIINSFNQEQINYLEKMKFNDSGTWERLAEDKDLKRSLSQTQKVAVMTYASELFSWYKGSVYADTYFCPERHGTYFGGFYMKDYPAIGNTDYFISTELTGNSGKAFLDILAAEERRKIIEIFELQKDSMDEILAIREKVSRELRKFISGEGADRDLIFKLIKRYGELDGEISYLYASRFAEIADKLTDEQKKSLVKIRNQDIYPEPGTGYLYSKVINVPVVINSDFLFGVGELESAIVEPSSVKIRKNNK